MRWASAGALAAGGIVAYLVIGGTLWWWLGLAAVMPLAFLLAAKAHEGDGHIRTGGSSGDGPWGAP